jgi:hypothetical protein
VIVGNGVHNSSQLGGVRLNCSTGECTMANLSFVTIADNFVAAGIPGGVICSGSAATNNTISNSIVVNNDTNSPVGTLCTVNYSDVDTVTAFPGTQNLDVAALFTNPPSDYTLMSSSMCIDHADPAVKSGLDYAGHPRVQGGRADMGAYEAR